MNEIVFIVILDFDIELISGQRRLGQIEWRIVVDTRRQRQRQRQRHRSIGQQIQFGAMQWIFVRIDVTVFDREMIVQC